MGAVVQGHALQQHPLTAEELHEVRAEKMSPAKDPVRNRDALLVHPAQGTAVSPLQIRPVLRPGFLHLMMPVPPVIPVCSAIQRTAAGHSDVVGIAGVKQRAVVAAGAGFPVGKDQRIVPFRLFRREPDLGLRRCQLQLHTAFQTQRPGAVDPRREHQGAAARRTQRIDSRLQLCSLQPFCVRNRLQPFRSDARHPDAGQDRLPHCRLCFLHDHSSLLPLRSVVPVYNVPAPFTILKISRSS